MSHFRSITSLMDKLRPISRDIFKLCELLKFEPTWQQRQLLEAVQRGDRRISVRSGQGPGKTGVSTIIAKYRILHGRDSQVVVTAPTMRQCSDVWLTEFRLQMERGPEWFQRLFQITKKKVVVAGRESWGVITVTATRSENAQGFHRNVDANEIPVPLTIIGEEASGIQRDIITQFLGTLSNPDQLFLLIGNPNTRDCYFFDTHHGPQAKNWTTLAWNAEQSPIVSKQHCIDLAEEFGRDSDTYRIRVLGEFPHSDPKCVMSTEHIYPLMDDALFGDAVRFRVNDKPVRTFGLDFARFGGDESTLFARSGLAIVEWDHWAHREPEDVLHHAFRLQKDLAWSDNECVYVPDAGGMGQGVLGQAYTAGKTVHEFHNQGCSSNSQEFHNKITEAYFHVARLARRLAKGEYEGAPRPNIPNDQILLRQLTTRQFHTNKKNQFILETKDEYMKRGFESPDRAEGLCMAFYPNLVATGRIARSAPRAARDAVRARGYR